MKKNIFVFAIIIHCLSTFAQESFFYNLTATSAKVTSFTKLYISYEIAGIMYQDSLDLLKKEQNFTKKLPQPVSATINTNSNDVEPISVFLANNNLNVSVSNSAILLAKSKLQDDFMYLTENDRIRPKYFPIYGDLSEKNDTIGLKKIAVVFDSLKNNDIKKSFEYFKANKKSLLSLFSFNRYVTFYADYSKVEKDFALLPMWAKNSPDGKSIFAKIQGAKSAQINTQAKNFSQQSLSGEKISLASFQGKYVFIDFWASWCAPCRKEHHALIRIYESFKTKDFEILSVSLDSDKTSWETAVIKDHLSWTQVSDLKGQLNEIAVLYGIQSIPANFLIDPKGVIIGKNLTSEQLNEALENLLNK